MTTTQQNTMNIELWQSIGAIADNESLMKRLTNYAKKLVKESHKDKSEMTKEDFFEHIERAEKEIEEGKGISFTNKSEMNTWLNSL